MSSIVTQGDGGGAVPKDSHGLALVHDPHLDMHIHIYAYIHTYVCMYIRMYVPYTYDTYIRMYGGLIRTQYVCTY